MATKEHTQAFNERQKQRGLKRVPVWVPADRADELKQISQQMREEHKRLVAAATMKKGIKIMSFKIETNSSISKEVADSIIAKHGITYAEDGITDVTEEFLSGDYDFTEDDEIVIAWNHHINAALIYIKGEDFRITLKKSVKSELVILDHLLNNTTMILA